MAVKDILLEVVAVSRRWSSLPKRAMTDQLTPVDKKVRLPLGTALVLGVAVAASCALGKDVLTPKAPAGGGDTGPRSADTSVAPIKPMMVDGNFDGADKIKASCEQELKRKCEIFGILYTNEKGEAKIIPFANDEKNNYFVWLGGDKFDPLTERMDGGKVKWVDDRNSVYFVGIPQEGSDTQLEILYYIDDNKKVWEIPEPRAFHRASMVKPTQLPTEIPTSTPTLAPTPSKTPTFAPSLIPIPATIGATVVKSTPIPAPASAPKPENKPIVEADGVVRPDFIPRNCDYLGNSYWGCSSSADPRIGKENDLRFKLNPDYVYEKKYKADANNPPGIYYRYNFTATKLDKIVIWDVK